MKRIVLTFAPIAVLLMLLTGCDKKQPIPTNLIAGVWETHIETELPDKAGTISMEQLLNFSVDDKDVSSGAFEMIISGEATLNSIGAAKKIPFTSLASGNWKIVDVDKIELSYNPATTTVMLRAGKDIQQQVLYGLNLANSGYEANEAAIVPDKIVEGLSQSQIEQVRGTLLNYFKSQYRKNNEEKGGFSSVKIDGRILTVKTDGGLFGNKQVYENVTEAMPNPQNSPQMAAGSYGTSGLPNYDWLSQRDVTYSDIVNLSLDEIRIMRNYIFARHGYIFKSDDLRQFFSQYPWYEPRFTNVNRQLSKLEQRNIQFLKAYE